MRVLRVDFERYFFVLLIQIESVLREFHLKIYFAYSGGSSNVIECNLMLLKRDLVSFCSSS